MQRVAATASREQGDPARVIPTGTPEQWAAVAAPPSVVQQHPSHAHAGRSGNRRHRIRRSDSIAHRPWGDPMAKRGAYQTARLRKRVRSPIGPGIDRPDGQLTIRGVMRRRQAGERILQQR